jgi:hypothetical protein
LENINTQELLKLWKKGKTLYESLFEFSDKSLINNYNKSQLELENQTNSIPENNSNGKPSMMDNLQAFQSTFNKYQGTRNANDKLKRDLLNKILSEKLAGLGFESPIKTSSQPQLIPIHIWPQKINEFNWNESSFLSNGVEFQKIRIIKNIEFKKERNIQNKKKEIQLPDFQITDKSVGRPSKKQEIINAYNLLKNKNKIDYSKTFKSHTPLIREAVRLQSPTLTDDKGLGDEAIRRTVKSLFDQEKKEQK